MCPPNQITNPTTSTDPQQCLSHNKKSAKNHKNGNVSNFFSQCSRKNIDVFYANYLEIGEVTDTVVSTIWSIDLVQKQQNKYLFFYYKCKSEQNYEEMNEVLEILFWYYVKHSC